MSGYIYIFSWDIQCVANVFIPLNCFQILFFRVWPAAIKPRSMECCSDAWLCPSVDFCRSWSSTRVTIRFFITTLTKALLNQLLSFARRPTLRRILVVSNFSIKGNIDNMFLWPFNEWRKLVSELYRLFFWLILLWYALSAAGPFIKTCEPFQIIPIQLNLPRVTFTQSLVTPTSNMNAPDLNSNCPR